MMALVLCVVGCKDKPPPPVSGSAAPPIANGSTPPVTAGSAAITAPTLSPLEQVLREIRPDGTWSKDTALRAFAAAYGDLPGVKAPPGVSDGPKLGFTTIARRMLLRYWSAITPAQRDAASAIYGMQLGELTRRYVRNDVVYAAPSGLDDLDDPDDPGRVGRRKSKDDDIASASQIAPYQKLLDETVAEISRRVQRTLPCRLAIRLREVQIGRTTVAETIVKRNAAGDITDCTAHIYKLGRTLPIDSVEFRSALAHETWHAFQNVKLGSSARFNALPTWIAEGQAMWVGESLVGGTALEITVRHWKEYLLDRVDQHSLFARGYDAIGFYAHLEDEGINVWLLLDKMLELSPDNRAMFDLAVGGTKAQSSWGSSFFLDPHPTDQFTMTKSPGRPPSVLVPHKNFALANGDTAGVYAKQPATNDFAEVDVSTDVLSIEVVGHGILGDLAGPVYELHAEKRSFCVKAPCKCPDGTSPIDKLVPIGAKSRIAVSGDATAGSSATLTAYSMEEFCKGPKPTQRYKWQGVWKSARYPINGTFELDVTMTSTKISGAIAILNSDCVSAGAVEGKITAGTVEFGTVDAGPRVVWNGTIAGSRMTGTFTAEGCGDDGGSWSAQR
jgi:hypothetical protein